MPYSVRKRKCKKSTGRSGSWVLSYTDRKGKRHSNCHSSEKGARAQIAAIEMGEGAAAALLELIREELIFIAEQAS